MEENENVIVEEGLSLKDIFYIIKKHLIIIVAIIAALTILGFIYAKYKENKNPVFKADASLMVSAELSTGQVTGSQYTLSQYLADTYVVFLTKDVVLEPVSKKMIEKGYENVTVRYLKSNFKVQISGDSLILDCSYQDKSKEQAIEVLNCILDTAVEQANMLQDPTEPRNDETNKPLYKFLYENIAVLDKANERHVVQVSNLVKLTLIFFAIGVVLAFLAVLILEITDNKFKNIDEVERILGTPVLSAVPTYTIPTEKEEE